MIRAVTQHDRSCVWVLVVSATLATTQSARAAPDLAAMSGIGVRQLEQLTAAYVLGFSAMLLCLGIRAWRRLRADVRELRTR